jgi:hypothetical protein
MQTIAKMYCDGIGVKPDMSQANFWFNQAKINNYDPSPRMTTVSSPSIDEEPFRKPLAKFFRVPKTKTGKAIYSTIVGAFLILIILVGCQATVNKIIKPIDTPLPNIDQSQTLTDKIASDVDTVQRQATTMSSTMTNSTTIIEANATQGKIKTSEGRSYTGDELKKSFIPLWDAILVEMPKLWGVRNEADKIVAELEGTKLMIKMLQEQLSIAKEKSEAAQKQYLKELVDKDKIIENKDYQIAKLKNELTDKTAQLWRWAGLACGGVLAVAGVLFFVGASPWSKRLAVGLAIGGGIGLTLSLLIGQTLWMWPYILGGFMLIGVVWVIYDLFVKNKAVRELVQTNEAAKMYLSPDQRLSLFGNGPLTGDADHIQSGSTKRVVAAIRPKVKQAPKQAPVLLNDGLSFGTSNSSV